ncbi:MAG: bifunctional glutamate N-acetyltransferase/amino-acid acetyltransferase ArgJ [Thermoguttaceae bacterium]
MTFCVPKGFLLAGVHCRIKRDVQKQDLSLVLSETPAAAAGVYTQNLFYGAPVTLDRARTPSNRMRAVAICSGVANSCTGERGLRDAEKMAALAAAVCNVEPEQVLVLSTGVIGTFLPMDKIEQGISAAAVKLGNNEACLLSAARGMLTTDTVHKIAGRSVNIAGREIIITGIAKGAAMMGPNMATMLALIMTDAPLDAQTAQTALRTANSDSFNCISVDGHMSTNDTVLLLANGAAGGNPLAGKDLEIFQGALDEVCVDLAKSIPADGEGASHLITIELTGCADRDSALMLAKTVANSPLVKTAITGADPNWGRIVSAAGYADVPFDPKGVSLRVNGFLLYDKGAPVDFDAHAVSSSIRENRETLIQLQFSEGTASRRFWTTDLTTEYVRLNADYHT